MIPITVPTALPVHGLVGVDVAPKRIEQYILLFNSFVLMQLFNQVGTSRLTTLLLCLCMAFMVDAAAAALHSGAVS